MKPTHVNTKPFENIRSVLVVLSSTSMSIDMPGLRNLITHAYPQAAVFFISTSGDALGAVAPDQVDLVIDFTPPGARQKWCFARKMKSKSTYSVGRNSGWFVRKHGYTRIVDEQNPEISSQMPKDYLAAEAFVQKKVLESAGVPFIKQGGVTQDRGKDIALEISRS